MTTESIEAVDGPPARKKRGSYKKNPAAKKTRKPRRSKDGFVFLYFVIKKDEYNIRVPAAEADLKALEIYYDPQFKGVKQIFLMKPIKAYSKPTLNVVKL